MRNFLLVGFPTESEAVLTRQRNETSSVEWNVHIEHGAHAIDDSRVYHGDRCVQIASDFTARPGEIEMGRSIGLIDVNLELDLQYCLNSLENFSNR